MKTLRIVLILALFGATTLVAQEKSGEKIAVPFSDPSRPGFIEVGLLRGSISVQGYDGKEVLIETKNRGGAITKSRRKAKRKRRPNRRSEGMVRLGGRSAGLSVEEQHNKMSIEVGSLSRAVDIVIHAPRKTSLLLNTVNDGDIIVDHIEGELELNNVNGEIKALNVSGAVLSNTMNGDVTVTFDKIVPDKPMSFVSFNGDVDVTFPGALDADLRLKTEQGEIFTDYDVKLEERSKTVKEDRRESGGKFHLRIEKDMYGKIGKGGPEYRFSTFNGDIYIRRRK